MTTVATEYETVIGLEVHVQLLTRSKMFCSCPVPPSDAPPNTYVCPVCLGMPGVLPVINEQAVEFTIMTGLALNCEIPEFSKFDRKNYHYPDLMKGYQISQYDQPLTQNGWLEIDVDGKLKRVGITRVHLEEDTARSQHYGDGDGYSLIDVNRSGVPLMEIVSEPDMRSPEEARAYLMKLRQILRFLGTSNANMEEGNFRCDANVSLRPAGSQKFGAKVEVKNMNSFRAVYRALLYEMERQGKMLDAGKTIAQETRGWVESEGKTVSQRSKEFAHDYRYFPEPDLPPLRISREEVEAVRARLPELPDAMAERLQEQYGLSSYEAHLLTESRERAEYFERAVAANAAADRRRRRAKLVANWMLGELTRLEHAVDAEAREGRVTPEHLSTLIDLVEANAITAAGAKQTLERMFETGEDPATVVQALNLGTISGENELSEVADRVLAANTKALADYEAGKTEALQFLVGQFMRETRGRANPGQARELLLNSINRRMAAR